MRVAYLLLVACHSQPTPAPPPPGTEAWSEGTVATVEQCRVGISNIWTRDGGMSATFSVLEADGGERDAFVWVGSDFDVCGKTIHVVRIDYPTPGKVFITRSSP